MGTLFRTVLYRGPEHHRVCHLQEILAPTPHHNEGLSFKLGESKAICRFPTASVGRLVPLTPELFKGQLYLPFTLSHVSEVGQKWDFAGNVLCV